VYGLLFAGVYKLFAISNQLNDIRELLKRRSGEAADPYLAHAAQLQNAAHQWTVLDPKE
jgi:hypothetical protein